MENTGYSVGNLMLKITSESDKATKSLDSIIQKLTFMEAGLRSTIASFSELSKAVKSIDKTDFDWISAFATNLKNLDKSVSKINFEQFYIKMELFKEAMQYHGEVTIFHLSREMNTFANALQKIEGANTSKALSNLKKVVEMLPQMGYDGDVTIFSIGREMSAFANSLKKLEGMDIQKLASNIESIMSSIHQEGQPTSMFSIGREMNSFANALNKIGDAKVENIVANIKEFTKALEPMLQMAERSSGALQSLATVLTKLNKAGTMNKMVQDSKDKRKSFFGMEGFLGKTLKISWMVGKFYLAHRYSKMLFGSMTGILRKAIDYEETLNLWQVAMRENVDLASKFIHEMSRAYSLSETTLMNYQAIFKNMLSALGNIADDVSYSISESFLHMALDWASLFNTSIEKAANTFQAVLAGQVRPIRSVSGFDVTEVTIFELYQRLGGEKTTRQLTQVEKRLLRILAVFEQMEASGALGDLSKTLSNSANQLRMIREQMNEIMVWGGQFVEMWLTSEKVLIKVTAVLVTIKEILRALAIAFGYVQKDFLEGMFDPVGESAEDASEAIDGLMGRLFSFDKFESLSKADGVGNLIEIDQTIVDAMKAYQTILADVNNEAQQLADHWLGILGFTYDAEQGVYVFKGEIDETIDKAKEVGKKIALWAGVLVGAKHPLVGLGLLLAASLSDSRDIVQEFKDLGVYLKKIEFSDKFIQAINNVVDGISDIIEWGPELKFLGVKSKIGSGETLGDEVFGSILASMTLGALAGVVTGSMGVFTITTGLSLLLTYKGLDWKDEEATVQNLIITAIAGGLGGAVLGGKIGAAVGGPGGALLGAAIGLALGVALSLYLTEVEKFDTQKEKNKFLYDTLVLLVGALGGAGLGWSLTQTGAALGSVSGPVGTIVGAVLGLALGVAITFLVDKVDWSDIWQKAMEYRNAVPSAVEDALGGNVVVSPTVTPNPHYKGVPIKMTPYAQGGFIEDGIFTMNKGEIAGKFFDGTSVVINNDSIITAVSMGVASAVERVMSKQSSGGDVYIDGHKAGKVLEKHIYSESERVGRYAY